MKATYQGLWNGLSDEGIQAAIRIVKAHGFDATPITGGVSIDMPYSADNGKVQGVEQILCTSHGEVFAALGY